MGVAVGNSGDRDYGRGEMGIAMSLPTVFLPSVLSIKAELYRAIDNLIHSI